LLCGQDWWDVAQHVGARGAAAPPGGA
jgi:hypothetical protein